MLLTVSPLSPVTSIGLAPVSALTWSFSDSSLDAEEISMSIFSFVGGWMLVSSGIYDGISHIILRNRQYRA